MVLLNLRGSQKNTNGPKELSYMISVEAVHIASKTYSVLLRNNEKWTRNI